MSRVTQIDIHFRVGDDMRRAIIRPEIGPGLRVEQIFLRTKGPFDDPKPQEINLDGEDDGKGPEVCYLIDGQMVCW
jgi:hypothetical protein